jgi:imidazole glycerol-phosphate synthase subunit HisF
MRRFRVIPVLMIHQGGLYKSEKFKNHTYVGDPINAVRIFNDKEVDELIIVDIDASREGRGPNMQLLSQIASEAFMPMGYGGGLSNINQVKQLVFEGYEKAVFNYSAIHNLSLIEETAHLFGSSSTVVSIDVGKNWLGNYKVYELNGKRSVNTTVVDMAKRAEAAGAGELFINSIHRDGTFEGYDIPLIKEISAAVKIPVIANGGAASVRDFKKAITEGGASAVAAGSMFVFQMPHKAVLITYPDSTLLNSITN